MKRLVMMFAVILVALLALPSLAAEKFPIFNVSFESNSMGTRFIGEIRNDSGKAYENAIFKISVYDRDGKLLDVLQAALFDFQKGMTDSFEAYSTKKITNPDLSKLKVKLEMGM